MTSLTNCSLALTSFLVLASAAEAASFTPLGHVPGGSFSNFGRGVSDDGGVAVGIDREAFRWTAANGIEGLGFLPGGSVSSAANDVSGDGTVVVGSSRSTNSGIGPEAFRWTSGGGMVGLGDLPGGDFRSEARAASADGSVIVGNSQSADGNSLEAFRWTSGGGMVGLGDFPDGNFLSGATGVSADGNVVVGFGRHQFDTEAFRWTAGSGLVGLGDLPGADFLSTAWGVSADGAVVVGNSNSTNSGFGGEAFRWTAGGGMVGLGDLPGGNFTSRATGASGDGSVVVGFGNTDEGAEAFIWTQADGMQRLIDVLIANGATGLDGWILTDAQAISADGRWVVGGGRAPEGFAIEPFLAFIPPGPAPPSDVSHDITTFVDVTADAIPDLAGFIGTPNVRPRIAVYSGANGNVHSTINYLNNKWRGIAVGTVRDGNQDGVADDPAVGVLADNKDTQRIRVQSRRLDSGALLGSIEFLSAKWRAVDVVVVDDTNGDGVSSDTSIAVLAERISDGRVIIQIRDFSSGALISNINFFNVRWSPVAAAVVDRSAQAPVGTLPPLIGVVAENVSLNKRLLQSRFVNSGALHKNIKFLNSNWHYHDVSVIHDLNGDAINNDPVWQVLATRVSDSMIRVQTRLASNGVLDANTKILSSNWEGLRLDSSLDIDGNLSHEMAVLARRRSDQLLLIQIKDYATGTTTINVAP